ncbi:MAG TPA: methylaspartate mutase accessory protein GlmL [Methylomirabilota bacterium]|nr:methylaspartate mutase accessory protein GlmL [Methylomirabilota bacterium]
MADDCRCISVTSVALLIDFGSTFTKASAVDLGAARLIGRSQAPSTVASDVREGLLQALAALHRGHPIFDRQPKDLSALEGRVVLASSSAAGGLRIAVVGNVPGLTVEAANHAALGAGAKIVGATAFKISQDQMREIEALRPDMILLTGGVDGGDSATILHNARALARSAIAAPVVVAGNRAAAGEICEILRRAGKEARLVDNVMPETGTLAVEAAREEIRRLFMERITHAKGLDEVKGFVSAVLPTPLAVLEGIRLGAEGTARERGWGDMVVVDVGGATTDVHSIGYGRPAGENVIARGLDEPYAKRTVEGDLGIRFNATTILSRVGLPRLAGDLARDFPQFSVTDDSLEGYIKEVSEDTGRVPQAEWHCAADAVLARAAVDLALARHVGRRERIVAREGEAWVHSGKDLRDTRTLIGAGGVFVHNPFGRYILSPGAMTDDRVQPLRPKNPRLFLDASYLLYAVGLLSQSHPDVALKLFKSSMRPA